MPSHWGSPTTTEDLTRLFLDYLDSNISTTPFSPSPLSDESITILEYLKKLTSQGLWTVCSQPAIDNASSTDEIFGWGPRGGYVSQKGFVEFFTEENVVDEIERKIEREGNGWIHFFAANLQVSMSSGWNWWLNRIVRQGECRTNIPDDGRNAVTWGVFPGQEVVQTTIIERESFLTWKVRALYFDRIQCTSSEIYRRCRMKLSRYGRNGHLSTPPSPPREHYSTRCGRNAG